jgi:hypothetical protein
MAVYSAICGGKDNPRTDVKCFTEYDKFHEPRRNAKIYRALSHLFVPGEYSLWVDGNIFLKYPEEYFIEMMGDADVLAFKHPYGRDCLYQEAEECIKLGLDYPEIIKEQTDRYKKEGYPEHNGLWQTGVLLRRHTPEVISLNNKWWAEICRGSMRDQISFPYVFSGKVKTVEIQGDPFNNKHFKKPPHKIDLNGRI